MGVQSPSTLATDATYISRVGIQGGVTIRSEYA